MTYEQDDYRVITELKVTRTGEIRNTKTERMNVEDHTNNPPPPEEGYRQIFAKNGILYTQGPGGTVAEIGSGGGGGSGDGRFRMFVPRTTLGTGATAGGSGLYIPTGSTLSVWGMGGFKDAGDASPGTALAELQVEMIDVATGATIYATQSLDDRAGDPNTTNATHAGAAPVALRLNNVGTASESGYGWAEVSLS